MISHAQDLYQTENKIKHTRDIMRAGSGDTLSKSDVGVPLPPMISHAQDFSQIEKKTRNHTPQSLKALA